jgi:hypothetical protein
MFATWRHTLQVDSTPVVTGAAFLHIPHFEEYFWNVTLGGNRRFSGEDPRARVAVIGTLAESRFDHNPLMCCAGG